MRKLRSTVVSLCLVAGCSSSHVQQQPAPSAQPSNQVAANAYETIMAKTTIDGKTLSRKGRATAMVVFASWCEHCRRELGYLGELRTRYPELHIIGLNAYEEYGQFSDRERLKAYVKANAPWLTDIVPADKELLQLLGGVPKIPTMFFYDANGNLVTEFRANRRRHPTIEELASAIENVLAR